MLTIIKTLAIVLATAGLTFVACDARAAIAQSPARQHRTVVLEPPADPCATAEVARADADLVIAQGLARSAWTPREERMAAEYLDAAIERKRTALAVCAPATAPTTTAYAPPFESESDPWQADATTVDTDVAEAAAVLGCEATPEAVQAAIDGLVRQ
jgi:hypothetical protein